MFKRRIIEVENDGQLPRLVFAFARSSTNKLAGRGGFQQRDMGPPAQILGKLHRHVSNLLCVAG